MNPFEAIQEYDDKFAVWWEEVRRLSNNVLPTELDPNFEYAPGKFMSELDPFGCFDDEMSPEEFVKLI